LQVVSHTDRPHSDPFPFVCTLVSLKLTRLSAIFPAIPAGLLTLYGTLRRPRAELAVFPELAVSGYPPRDLLFKRRFVTDVESTLAEIASVVGEVPALVGFVETNTSGHGRPFSNAAAWCERGEVRLIARKCLLPTYDVFDEDRYFEPAPEPRTIEFAGQRIGLTICEDI